MRVLVTGGTGFVGSHSVAALLRHGLDAKLLVRRADRVSPALEPLGVGEVDTIEGDVTDPTSVERALKGCDAVLHAAGVYTLDARAARRIRRVNVAGTENVLHLAARAGCDPIVYVSSYVALLPPEGDVLRATSPVKSPPGAYVGSKAEAERIARRWQREAPITVSYPGAVLGPNDPHFGDSSQLVAAISTGGLRVTVPGGASFVDVRDLGHAHACMLKKRIGGRRYMVGGHYLTFNALIERIAMITGRSYRCITVPAAVGRVGGRFADLVQRIVPQRLNMSFEGAYIFACAARCDSTEMTRELEVEFRNVDETLSQTLRWLLERGFIQPRHAENLVGASNEDLTDAR